MSFIADIWGANKQAGAAKDAANVQAQSAKDANALQLQMYNQSRTDNEPFRQNGLAAQTEFMRLMGLSQPQQPTYQPQSMTGGAMQATMGGQQNDLAGMLGGSRLPAYKMQQLGMDDDMLGQYGSFNGMNTGQLGGMRPLQATQQPTAQQAQQDAFAQFRANPGYQFGLDEGTKAVQASAAARGGLNSGSALKSLFKYGNDYADQQGFTPYMNRLASLSGMGQTATSQNAQLGQNYANQTGANLNNAAQARAQGIYGAANAWTNGVSNAISGVNRSIGQMFGGGF